MPFPAYFDSELDVPMTTYQFEMPDRLWVFIFGALEELTDPDNHSSVGTYTAEETADMFIAIVEDLRASGVVTYIPPE